MEFVRVRAEVLPPSIFGPPNTNVRITVLVLKGKCSGETTGTCRLVKFMFQGDGRRGGGGAPRVFAI